MISSWRRRRAARRAAKELHGEEGGDMELTTPNHFRCPISLDLMKDPVTLSTGITYDRDSIEKWIETGNSTCPITNQVLTSLEPIPNHTIRKMIQDWCVDNQSHGIERIPTPRMPVSSIQVSEILSRITTASKREDQVGCRNLVAKIKAVAKESERNKRCIVTNGTDSVLSAAFEVFSKTCLDENISVLEEILSTLTLLFPLNGEAVSYLGSNSSLHCMIWFLKSGDLSKKRNAVLVMKDVVSSDQRKANVLSEIEGAMEALFKLIKEPICPASTNASLMVLHQMVMITSSVKESERNKRCIVTNGTDSVLSAAFEVFSKTCLNENISVLEEILSTLTLLFPLNGEAVSYLGSNSSLHCMVWFLKSGDLSKKRNAVLVMKDVVSSDQRKANVLSEIEGAMEALFKLIKEPICPASTKASLMVIYKMVMITSSATNERIVTKFVEMGMVSLLLELLVDSERSICEKSLGVLDGICSTENGRAKAYNNALTMSVVVKKILRMSDLATEFSVSILWKLCKNEKRKEKSSLVEALQVGAFQKLLLLLQVVCAEITKKKANELLRLLNLNRYRLLECIDFKDL